MLSIKSACTYDRNKAFQFVFRGNIALPRLFGNSPVSCNLAGSAVRLGRLGPRQKISGYQLTRLSHSQSHKRYVGLGSAVRYVWQRKFRSYFICVNNQLNIISALFAKQCSAIVAQRMRRTLQTASLYKGLGYDGCSLRNVLSRLNATFFRKGNDKPFFMLLGAALFSWEKDQITEEEINSVGDEMYHVNWGQTGEKVQMDENHKENGWEVIIDRPSLVVWRKNIPETYLYEYKVLGTYRDIPARAFYNAQIDFEYRKSWDKLIVKLDVIDADPESGCDIVQWITKFPYPMYNREYVYIRKTSIDYDQKVIVFKSRSIKHPLCPEENKNVRVNTYMSQMVVRPHTTFDENGFDYILTYYDDPQAVFPSPAYNWMARTGVPDFVDKMHTEAKRLHQLKKGIRGDDSTTQQADNQDQMAM